MNRIRSSALRSFQSATRPQALRSVARVSAPGRTQLVARRGYASGGEHAEPSSDLPWLAGAIAVTIPSCWYLWPDESNAEHSHVVPPHSGEENPEADSKGGDEEEGGEEEAPADDAAPADEEASADSGDSKQAEDDSNPNEEPESAATVKKEAEETSREQAKEDPETAKPSGSEGESQPASNDANKSSHGAEAAETKDTPEGKGSVEGVQFKGATNAGDDDNKMGDTRKREPDSKGAFKKRIDSGYGKDLGQGGPIDDESEQLESASSKTPKKGNSADISSKQLGMSNTPTRHSTQIDQDPEKSKKGEGTPETAKSMGTVSVDRPAPESSDGGEK